MTVPASPLLVDLAVALPVALFVAYVIAWLMERIFGARLSLSLATMTVISLLGVAVGVFISGWFFTAQRVWMPTTLVLAFGSSLGLSLLISALVVATRGRRGEIDVVAVLSAGESESVEFKETARWNVREEKRDARMELAIAKTVAAFMNSRGGVLVIGANDEGEATGLDRDLATLRIADNDRFELWLRDLLSTMLGRTAAALPRIQFSPAANGVVVCGVRCPPAARPVFLHQGKDAAGGKELWIRVGNSTRSLGVDEAVEYVSRHWRRSFAAVLLGRPVAG